MRGDVVQFARPVAVRGKHFSFAHQHRADRNLAPLPGGARFGKRKLHEIWPAVGHLASAVALC
jgi:hypothetical protein